MLNRNPSRGAVMAAFAAVYLVWGSTYLAIRVAIQTIPPFLMAGSRFLLAGSLLYAWSRLRGAPAPRPREWRGAALIGGLLLLGGNGGVVWAEQRVPSGLTALLVASVPSWTVLLEWLTGSQRPNARVVAGLLLGLAGVALLAAPGQLAGGEAVDPTGALVLLLASFTWSVASVLTRRVPLPSHTSVNSAAQMLAGGALLLGLSVVLGEPARADLGRASTASITAFLYLIAFGSLVGFSAFAWLLRVVPPTQVATYAYVNPAVAVVLGWAILDERLTTRSILAAAVIVAGVVLIVTGKQAPRKT